MNTTRRQVLAAFAVSGTGLLVNACRGPKRLSSEESAQPGAAKAENGGVSAVEDLMREHGVLRRCLLVYSETATLLRGKAAAEVLDGLRKTAGLFRSFGEDYHEKKLEEAFLFPAIKHAGHAASPLVDVLATQHRRGGEITEYILSATRRVKTAPADAETLAHAIETFVRMYRNHAAREDTVVFPAWKRVVSPEQLDAMGDRFEEIEHRQFGEDGFDDAVRQIGAVEDTFGLADLARFTAPPPPSK
jgi:hemerythrin-like domain-containing protein